MARNITRNFRTIFLLLLLWVAPLYQANAEDITFPTDNLVVAAHDKKISFTVEVATSPAQHERGLMFRKSLARDHGMLFDFGQQRHVDFWMKNTLIPLDMVFIDKDGVVTQIVENAKPESLDTIPSESDVRAVMEIAGGTARFDHIAKGDRVIYSIFP